MTAKTSKRSLIVSLPSIVANSIFGLNGTKPVEGATLTDTYSEMAKAVSSVVDYGYELSLARVDRLIEEGGCDYKLSMDSLINYGHSSAGYDTCYVLAAYSASMEQQNTSKEDMMAKLQRVADSMFPVTSERKEHEHLIPVTYYRYEPVTLTVISSAEIVDFNGDDPVKFLIYAAPFSVPAAQPKRPALIGASLETVKLDMV